MTAMRCHAGDLPHPLPPRGATVSTDETKDLAAIQPPVNRAPIGSQAVLTEYLVVKTAQASNQPNILWFSSADRSALHACFSKNRVPWPSAWAEPID